MKDFIQEFLYSLKILTVFVPLIVAMLPIIPYLIFNNGYWMIFCIVTIPLAVALLSLIIKKLN